MSCKRYEKDNNTKNYTSPPPKKGYIRLLNHPYQANILIPSIYKHLIRKIKKFNTT